MEEAKKFQVPSDREVVLPIDPSHNSELGPGDHGRVTPARRRSSISGAVGFMVPEAVPIEPPKKSWRPTFQRLVSGTPLVLKDETGAGPNYLSEASHSKLDGEQVV